MPDPAAVPQPSGNPGNFELWKEYEAIAMHFNDLLMRIRSGAIAAVAAVASASGVFLKGDSIDKNWGTLAAVFGLLLILWRAVYHLDINYYNRLLVGAVNALIHLERASLRGITVKRIRMSTEIARAVDKPSVLHWNSGKRSEFSASPAVLRFYQIVTWMLLIGMVFCTLMYVGVLRRSDFLFGE